MSDRYIENKLNWKHRKMAQGRCVQCGKKAVNSTARWKLCRYHMDYQRDYMRDYMKTYNAKKRRAARPKRKK